jgi:hypothetical protein
MASHRPVLPQRWSVGHEVAVQAAAQTVPEVEQHGVLVGRQTFPAPQNTTERVPRITLHWKHEGSRG